MRRLLTDPLAWPDVLRPHRGPLRGVAVGGCAAGRPGAAGLRAGQLAHAHVASADDPFVGWLCVADPRDLRFNNLLLHELAHVLTNEAHTPRWRAAVLALGGTLRATGRLRSYEVKRRR